VKSSFDILILFGLYRVCIYAEPLCCTWKIQHHFPMEFPVPSREWIFHLFHHFDMSSISYFCGFRLQCICNFRKSNIKRFEWIGNFQKKNIRLTLALSQSSEVKASNMLYPRVIATLYRFIYFIFLKNRFAIKKKNPELSNIKGDNPKWFFSKAHSPEYKHMISLYKS